MILDHEKLQIKWTEFSFMLKPSTLGGIGVFATHDIPAETPLFSGKPSSRRRKTKEIPAEFIKYCIFVSDDECLCPERFDRMGIGWYINHSLIFLIARPIRLALAYPTNVMPKRF